MYIHFFTIALTLQYFLISHSVVDVFIAQKQIRKVASIFPLKKFFFIGIDFQEEQKYPLFRHHIFFFLQIALGTQFIIKH